MDERTEIVEWLRKQAGLAEQKGNATTDHEGVNYYYGREAGLSEAADIIEAGMYKLSQ